MINSVNNSVSAQNPFGDVTKRTSQNSYWLGKTAQNSSVNTVKVLEENSVGSILPEILSPEEAKKTHNIKKIGLSIATVTFLAGGIIFALMKGGSKGFARNISALQKNIERKLQASKLNLEGSSAYNKILQSSLKIVDKMQKRINTANNFTTIKDVLFENLMKNRFTGKITGKIHSWITKMFSKIARRAVKLRYDETLAKLQSSSNLGRKMLKNIPEAERTQILEISGVKKTKGEWIKQLDSMDGELFENYEKYFGKNSQLSRVKSFKETLQGLKQQFEENGPFWFLSKKTLKGFVADSIVAPARKAIQKEVKAQRRIISYTLSDVVKKSTENILEMAKLLNVNDVDIIKQLRSISQSLNELPNVKESAKKTELINSIENQITKFVTDTMVSSKIKPEIADELYANAQEISSVIRDYKQGKIEDMLDIYKKLLSGKDYDKLEKAYKGNVVALDRSIRLETEDCFNKLRDITLGSAPTDILSVVAGFSTLAYYLLQSEKGKERNEIALKYGLPALTGLGAMVYGNAKLLAGTKSLTLSLITMFITNRLGDIANNLLVNYYKKQETSQNV